MIWAKVGSLVMFVAVFLGAFGAHALKAKLSDYYMDVYKTAVLYHMIHALGLFAVAFLSTKLGESNVLWAGIFMTAGIILFSGSLYMLSITGIKWLGAITPLGGVSFLIAWGMLFYGANR